MMRPIAVATNLSATRRTVRALRATERLTDANSGLVTLALTTADALDDALSGAAKAYEVVVNDLSPDVHD
jgi:hypothetical protein